MPEKISDVEDSQEIVAVCEIHGEGNFIYESVPNWWFCKSCASERLTRSMTANLVLGEQN